MPNRPSRSISVLLLACGLGGNAAGQEVSGLRFDFRARTLDFHLVVRDLEEAYQVTPAGDIQMLSSPESRVLADERLQVSVRRRGGGRGQVTILRGGQTHQTLIHADNRLAGDARVTGLPFGYAFLPRPGEGEIGQSWTEEFPAPQEDEGFRVHAFYRYTLKTITRSPGCDDCAEIEVRGFRRFLAGPKLDQALMELRIAEPGGFYVESQPFAAGSIVFDRKERFLHRYELNANPSLFTLLPIPGMMRQVVLERVRN